MAQESQNNDFSFKLTYKKNQIIRSLEIYKITFNKYLKNNDELKPDLLNLPTKITFFLIDLFYLIYFF